VKRIIIVVERCIIIKVPCFSKKCVIIICSAAHEGKSRARVAEKRSDGRDYIYIYINSELSLEIRKVRDLL